MVASEKLHQLEQQLTNVNSNVEEIDALNALAWELRERDSTRAHTLANRSLDLSRSTKKEKAYLQGTALALLTLGELANRNDEYGLALTQLLEAFVILQDLPTQELLGDTSHTIGWTHYELGNFKEAYEFYGQALKIFQDIGNQEKEASVITSLGTISSAEGNHSRAMEFFQRALFLLDSPDESRAKCVTLNNLALAQIRLSENEKALKNALDSLRIIKNLGLPSVECSILDTLGLVYLSCGNFVKAEETLKACLGLSIQMENEQTEFEARLNLGRVFLQTGDLEQAQLYFVNGLELANQRNLKLYQYKYHEMLTSIFERWGDNQHALYHYKEFHNAKNQVLSESAHYRLENLKILHKLEKARKESEILWLQNRALEQEIEVRRQEHAELERLATTDPLVGLFNRRHFFTLGEYELEKSFQTGAPLSLILVDIDHFKQVNDNFGHSTGDQALISISRIISENARKGDICCRIGGEEFVILLPEADLNNGKEVAERLRLAIFSCPLHINQNFINLTASLGVVQTSSQDASLVDVLARADQALYRAKSGGRNKISI
jgi:diguanylate cyclase (GGDEF)-like protein